MVRVFILSNRDTSCSRLWQLDLTIIQDVCKKKYLVRIHWNNYFFWCAEIISFVYIAIWFWYSLHYFEIDPGSSPFFKQKRTSFESTLNADGLYTPLYFTMRCIIVFTILFTYHSQLTDVETSSNQSMHWSMGIQPL